MNNHFTLVITLLFTLLTAPLGFSQSNTITKTMLFSEIQDKFVEGADAHKKGDFTSAYDNLSFAAQSGMKEAQYLLGFMYLKGEYVQRSIPVGMAWLGTALEIENKDWSALYSRVYHSLNEQQQVFIDRKVSQYIDIYGMDIQNVDCQLTSVIGSRKLAQRCTKQADRLTPLFSMEDIPEGYSPEFSCEATFPCLIGNLRIYDGVESHNGALPFQF
jgi:TPR repeat protein